MQSNVPTVFQFYSLFYYANKSKSILMHHAILKFKNTASSVFTALLGPVVQSQFKD